MSFLSPQRFPSKLGLKSTSILLCHPLWPHLSAKQKVFCFSQIRSKTMAPDRGFSPPEAQNNESAPPIPTFDIRSPSSAGPSPTNPEPFPSKSFTRTRSDFGAFLQTSQSHASATTGTNFTFRGVIVGALIGILICFSNTYFGLQTGWISGMAMPSALIGFAAFKTLSKHLQLPFSPVENVLVQTVAGAVGTMPLGCGFVGVIPALEFLLKKSEGAPIDLSLWKLIVWSLGICLFGVVFAVPLRKEVIVRERLKFPSGTATALMIGVLHGGFEKEKSYSTEDQNEHAHAGGEEQDALLSRQDSIEISREPAIDRTSNEHDERDNWKSQIRFMVMAFGVSAFYVYTLSFSLACYSDASQTLFSYFFPVLRDLPVFGYPLAYKWLWTLNPSPAYVGQGIIMGPATTLHMFLGALVGWAVLSPVAKHRGWAAGKVDDWENGSKGWIVWVSLAIMLADAIVNLGWLVLKASLEFGPSWSRAIQRTYKERSWEKFLPFPRHPWQHQYFLLPPNIASEPSTPMTPQAQSIKSQGEDRPPDDAPPQHLVSTTTVLILLPLTIFFCIFCIHFTFGSLIPISLIVLSVILALVLSVRFLDPFNHIGVANTVPGYGCPRPRRNRPESCIRYL